MSGVPPRSQSLSVGQARVAAAILALFCIGYPAAFYTWYFTADPVTAQVTSCDPHGKSDPTCHGDWTDPDGQQVSGGTLYVEGLDDVDVGTTVKVRARGTWAVGVGPFGSPQGFFATLAIGLDILIAVAFMVAHHCSGPAPKDVVP